jgi:hypothetical protein
MTSTNASARPKTLEEMLDRIQHLNSEESRRRGLAFQPLATDLFISPFPKCGTTWLQQIVHGLRTGGDMNFSEITEVVPWLEMAFDLGLDLDAPQPAPRAFKSHLTWDDIPKGARYIVSVRDPKDALISAYRFFEGWWFEPGSIPFSTFASTLFIDDRGYWRHLSSWWEHHADPNVLLLSYEDMKADLPQAVHTIAHFTGCEPDPQGMELVILQSSLPFMLAHEDQFDDHLVRNRRDPVCGLPLDGNSAKVTNASLTPSRLQLPPAIVEEFDIIWQEEIEAKFGLASYQSLRNELAIKRARMESR